MLLKREAETVCLSVCLSGRNIEKGGGVKERGVSQLDNSLIVSRSLLNKRDHMWKEEL